MPAIYIAVRSIVLTPKYEDFSKIAYYFSPMTTIFIVFSMQICQQFKM